MGSGHAMCVLHIQEQGLELFRGGKRGAAALWLHIMNSE